MTGVCRLPGGFGLAHVQERGEQPPRVASADVLPTSRGSLLQALQAGVARRALARSRCVDVMALGDYSLLQIVPPPVPDAELRDASRWQIRELIDYPIDEALIDVFRVPSEGMRGRSAIAYVVSAHRSLVKEQVNQLKAARLKIHAIDIPELAVRNLAALLPEEPRGVIFVYLGSTRGLITICRAGNLCLARNINIGVEQLKAHPDIAAGRKEDDSHVNDLLDSVVLEIQRSLDFYESNFALPPIASLVVASIEPELPVVIPYLQNYLGLGVRAFVPAEVLDCAHLEADKVSRCLLAIGAALRDRQVAP
ncbi:hypothetical protein [Trichloromonas sp.]|uniref:hypothetical protein n=1 Tax=Trichloromonas sp. TaxID=3069249 RepID=UPI003D81AD45